MLLSGTLKQTQYYSFLPNAVLYDVNKNASGITDYARGVVKAATLETGPTMSAHWKIYGWNVLAQVGFVAPQSSDPMLPLWARWGNLWAGVSVDENIASQGGIRQNPSFPYDITLNEGNGVLPRNLSTFSKIWTPEDPLPQISPAPSDLTQGFLVAVNYLLPVPLIVQPGSQLQFIIVLTRSLLCRGDPLEPLAYTVRTCDFSVLYEITAKENE